MTDRSGRSCSIDDCPDPAFGRGWCQRHYAIWRTHGDPLHPIQRRRRQGPHCSESGCPEKPRGNGLCQKHGYRMARYGTTQEPRERRFWDKVNKNGPISARRPDLGPCWVWTGYIAPRTGYGQFGLKAGVTRLVHRIAYEMLVGPIPDGMVLDHLCSRRECVAVHHLQPVTPRENIKRGEQGAFWGYAPEPVPVSPKPPTPERCTECGGDKPLYKRTLCRPCYRAWLNDPARERPAKPTPEQRFWAKVEKTDSCWLWTASVNKGTGYGQFGLSHGNMVQAHRYSYELAHGPIPPGLDVHHTCHRRRCVRPEHLRATSRSVNLAERKVRRV